MDPGVQLEVLWSDSDMFEVEVSARNARFSGSANIYLGIGGLAESADKLKGFPRDPSDKRSLEFGAFGPHAAGGAATLSFYCGDSAGHASVEVKIESDHRGNISPQSVLLISAVEAAAVDLFVSDLQRLETDQVGAAFLRTSW